MQGDYTFLTDHSYSIRVDYDKLPLKQREIKTKKPRRTPNRSNKTKPTNRTVSIDRSSSDKENTSTINTSRNKRKSPMKNKISQSNKKQNNKTSSKSSVKSTENSIIKKKKSIIKSLNSHLTDASPSLSIEERVKLRRTKPLLISVKPVLNKKLKHNINHPIKKLVKRIHLSKSKKNIIKSKKYFLGSGLDLDNIVLGNRQRRSVQT